MGDMSFFFETENDFLLGMKPNPRPDLSGYRTLINTAPQQALFLVGNGRPDGFLFYCPAKISSMPRAVSLR